MGFYSYVLYELDEIIDKDVVESDSMERAEELILDKYIDYMDENRYLVLEELYD